jgi:hypothetical protein
VAVGGAQRFVARHLVMTHRVDALVSAFLASLARHATLAIVGIAVQKAWLTITLPASPVASVKSAAAVWRTSASR